MYYIYGYLFQSFRQVQIYGKDWSQQTEKEASVLTTTVLGEPRLKSLMGLWIWTDATFFVSECNTKILKLFVFMRPVVWVVRHRLQSVKYCMIC